MLFATPQLTDSIRRDLDELDGLRQRLNRETQRPGPWMGTVRRLVRGAAIAQSTGIEGFRVSEEDAVALAGGEAHAETGQTDRMAVECYARAMDHVATMARDPGFRWSERVILDLHFDTCWFQRADDPGLFRTGPIGITGGGRLAYQAPDADQVPTLMREVVEWLADGDPDAPVVVRAAMAHLHVVSIHPFRDGNGRVSRIAQSLVLARERLLAPEFTSIEEHLGQHTQDYYDALQHAHGPTYDATRDASGWVAFCVDAHLSQAQRRLVQIDDAAVRWERLEALAAQRRWPDRFVIALEQSLFGGADRASYAREADVSAATASSDLRRMAESGLLEQRGAGPSTRYEPTAALKTATAR